MRLNLATGLVASVFGLTADARACDGDLTVRTKGGVVHGTTDSATPAVRQFLGIPYARPPLNDLRFAPPQPALPFGELDAKKMPPSCMQYVSNTTSVITQDVLEFNLGGLNGTTGPISEDCLTLSVWAPRGTTKKNLPVIIFLYGGAFTVGGTDVPYLIPAQWIQRTQDHIVVAFNHRDNIFGYPNAAGLAPHERNVGLLDARLAIEWVRDNIASFGGDPTRIGLWGESSGAIIISYYSYVYRDDPIANSVILASGNEFIDILVRDPAHSNFTFVASHFGCDSTSPAEELACMRKVDAFAIADFVDGYIDAGTAPPLFISAVIDGHTVFDNYAALAQAGKVARLPALIGSNAQDGVLFVPYSPDGVDEALADQTMMTYFFCPTYQAARARVAAHAGDVPVYRYVYAGNFSNVSPRGWMGAYHGAEMPLVFGTHPLFRGNSTELEYATGYAMQDTWLRFVATAGEEMAVEGWDARDGVDGGRVVEFGNGVPARLMDTAELEKQCREMGLA
ncbi:Alpha/Beta hydrolase protein [Parachaetomium inaequale]|uniref:Carboxylic ester hydrolase n=1 Tax=Parachaetomium inaequale TaxID=2588326 RepID=A0AAN6SN25_9PEZI|nr:Alpha/Beta hydrolase protein [Parachaetomium inaequale]